jgi:hypothetical protein
MRTCLRSEYRGRPQTELPHNYLADKVSILRRRGFWIAFYITVVILLPVVETCNRVCLCVLHIWVETQSTYRGRVEIGGVYLPSQLERTPQLCT